MTPRPPSGARPPVDAAIDAEITPTVAESPTSDTDPDLPPEALEHEWAKVLWKDLRAAIKHRAAQHTDLSNQVKTGQDDTNRSLHAFLKRLEALEKTAGGLANEVHTEAADERRFRFEHQEEHAVLARGLQYLNLRGEERHGELVAFMSEVRKGLAEIITNQKQHLDDHVGKDAAIALDLSRGVRQDSQQDIQLAETHALAKQADATAKATQTALRLRTAATYVFGTSGAVALMTLASVLARLVLDAMGHPSGH